MLSSFHHWKTFLLGGLPLLTYFADLSGPDCEPPELSETRWFEGMLGQADLKHILISAVFRYFPDNVRAILGIV